MTNESPPVPATPSGWYPDPWSSGHHRYWDGAAWTSSSFPNGVRVASGEGVDAAEASTIGGPVSPPPWRAEPTPPWLPPPAWTPPSYATADPAPTATLPAPPPFDRATKRSRIPTGAGFVALVVAVMLVVGSIGTWVGYEAFGHHSSNPSAAGTSPTLPPAPTDPSAASLASLVITQADVAPTVVVQPDQDGNSLSTATLDLCNGTFPSESLRTARLQVTAYDGVGNSIMSTEAVLYTNPAATTQAFSELKSVAANCPSTPVVSPIGEPTSTTQFNAAPDSSWAQTPTVTRQAYDFVSTDDTGTTSHNIAVYLRRGRVLEGVYFHQPDSPPITVAGQNTIASIVGVFAGRIAKLPTTVVNG